MKPISEVNEMYSFKEYLADLGLRLEIKAVPGLFWVLTCTSCGMAVCDLFKTTEGFEIETAAMLHALGCRG